MSLKLLFVNASLTDGGSEKAMSLVAQALTARGHDVTMALVREKERTYAIDSTIEIIQFKYQTRGKVRKAISRMKQIRDLIKVGQYDYVICYMWDLNVTTLFASLGLQERIIVSERNFPGTPTRSKFSRLLERVFYKFAYRIVYQTADAQAFCPPKLFSRSVVVPNIVEVHELQAFTGRRAKRIVSIGRLIMQKNFPLLLNSFAEFSKTNPGWTLEIYGKGPLEAELRALATKLSVANSVVFAGYVADLGARTRDATMFVLSSDFEGISNAMSEAMALGLPVVCTDCPAGGAALLIKNRVSGLLVPVRDQRALVSAMNEVATDDDLAKRLSQGARASAARFAPERMSRTWEESVLC